MPEESNNLSTLIKKYITTEFLTVATFLIYAWGFLYKYKKLNNVVLSINRMLSKHS